MTTTTVRIAFPALDDAAANEQAQSLLSELKQDSELRGSLDLEKTRVARTDKEAMDFGATLIAVLGTQAVIILARAIKSWIERTGTSTIELNGVRIDNVRSCDVASIISALQMTSPATQKS
jgi:Effector Associated Constant Component 1